MPLCFSNKKISRTMEVHSGGISDFQHFIPLLIYKNTDVL